MGQQAVESTPEIETTDGIARYRCGTLSYTKLGLVNLFVWMLWGDFCYVLMDMLIPTLLPLLLKQHQASNFVIGLLVGSIPAFLDFFLCPIISTASDRTRSRWGRRIPYMLFTAPFVTLFLVLTGWSDALGQWLHTLPFGPSGTVAATVIVLLAIFAVGFQLFNMFVGSVFYYIFADVVPKPLIGRFMSLFRLIGTAAGFVFKYWIMPMADNSANMPWIFTGVAGIYLFGCVVMCLMVKEGEYPPPPATGSRGLRRMADEICGYFRDCFSVPYYMVLFVALALNTTSNTCRVMFNLLFAQHDLGLSAGAFGRITGIVSLTMLAAYIPLGWLVDKFHPLRIFILGAMLIILANVFGFFCCHDYGSFCVVCFLVSGTYVLQNASELPLTVRLYPADQYGQFCSAAVMVRSITLIVANAGAGAFIDRFGYRALFIWDFVFTAIAAAMLMVTYRMWKGYGGDRHYVAPRAKNALARHRARAGHENFMVSQEDNP